MNQSPLIKTGLIPALCAIFLTDRARAENIYIQLSNSTAQTLINCCMIIAAGMIICALIFRKWK